MKEQWKFRYNGLARGIHTIEESDSTPIAHVVCDVDSHRRARMMTAAPEMLALLELLAAGYSISESMYDLRCKAEALVAKIERGDA